MTNYCNHDEFAIDKFFRQLIRPRSFSRDQLLANENQVAGHAGFYSSRENPRHCLKPFNTKCVRGRREHLFYQLVEHFRSDTSKGLSDTYDGEDDGLMTVFYKYFTLLSYPSPPSKCNCPIDGEVIRSLTPFVAKFNHVRHLTQNEPGDYTYEYLPDEDEYSKSVYSECLICPCYGRDAKQKSLCAREYDKVNFLCLEDLTAHCQKPCIIDIKIGQITYDPMAIKEKVLEESTKYRRLREFGFRILGMKLDEKIRDKSYGKSLKTTDQIRNALDSYFEPLLESQSKLAALSQILDRLRDLMDWFENKNINQLKFFSSSLLIVYDSHITNELNPDEAIIVAIKDSVRVNMIDFAHVFHVHDSKIDKGCCKVLDSNYIYGLRKLIEFLSGLESQYQITT